MSKRYPCGGAGRRDFLAAMGMAAAPAALGALAATHASAQEPKAAASAGTPAHVPVLGDGSLGIPGPYPGRVVEVRNPRMIRAGVKDREAIKRSVARGMKELAGADDAASAWRRFFEPGDVVGIKMNPVGNPLANTSSELMLEVVDGLKSAGVKARDIVVFERYQEDFLAAKMDRAVPDGIEWLTLGVGYNAHQIDIRGKDDRPLDDLGRVTGYDPDEFVHLEAVGNGEDPKDDRTRRSHLGLLVTRRVNKIVCLPVLKDHGSAGITGALKNMSHGLVNNVCRSHSTPDSNICNIFIPQVVSHPIIRRKCVLHIMDGIVGVYQGGPGAGKVDWTWENNALLFATDPVAMDRILWDRIDAKRKEKGLPPVAASGRAAADPLGTEGFDARQPQHVRLAGFLGLGLFELDSPRGRRFSIQHTAIDVS
ncbi:hypothetical protein OJF2_73380 [Aquisphaera giovannonii]|uniref:DUF362 domain-containing protein n=1 Tax=Aquisphaera giovannonii TaxID=406548 RepID=A0A5B9WDS8_9BACT|nr:DUF362 domain-containing protein [Aquisphaera giovannonii]QEH38732.1 hypothetical protein OJF2_73380 [Aquisphaera giovannonii]